MDADFPADSASSEVIHGSIETVMQVLDLLPDSIDNAAAMLTQSLLSECKILCCGTGHGAALSQIMASHLLNRFQYERPSLPAVSLGADVTTITAIAGDNSFQDIFSHSIRALGQPGDTLLMVAHHESSSFIQAIQAAHDREMQILVLHGLSSPNLSTLLLPEDLELVAPTQNIARMSEAHLLIINCLCELIDQQLFGGF